MSEERKKAVWPSIVALLIGLPVLYVVLFGPACWANARTGRGAWLIWTIYRPVGWIHANTPLRGPLGWWASVGVGLRFHRLAPDGAHYLSGGGK